MNHRENIVGTTAAREKTSSARRPRVFFSSSVQVLSSTVLNNKKISSARSPHTRHRLCRIAPHGTFTKSEHTENINGTTAARFSHRRNGVFSHLEKHNRSIRQQPLVFTVVQTS
jgi:hypothetical protein